MSCFVFTKDLTHEHVKVGARHINKHERVVCAKYVNVKSAPTIYSLKKLQAFECWLLKPLNIPVQKSRVPLRVEFSNSFKAGERDA